jgi:protein-serine/threonine kinase
LIDLAFPSKQPIVQKGETEEDYAVHDSENVVSNPKHIDRDAASSIYTVKKLPSDRKVPKKQRRDSTSNILLTISHQNLDPSSLSFFESSTEKKQTVPSSISLDNLIQRRRRLSIGETNCYFKQAISGVAYLHSVGIAHRDLSSDNLILATDGTLKITEFGCAESFRQSGGGKCKIRTSSRKCGDISYLAPEVFVERHFDPRSVDMWALGIVYMEMRTGKLLWNLAAEGGDDHYDKYLQDRRSLWGYRPIENLESVRYKTFMFKIVSLTANRRRVAEM